MVILWRFIVSDLHGCGSIYDSIIKYLENINSRDGEDIGKKGYLTIIGHTADSNNDYGFSFFPKGNYLNIDGGCAEYALGLAEHAHVPLVEIKSDGYLEILTFNENNEITYGMYFSGAFPNIDSDDLNKRREYLYFYTK